MHCVVRRGLEKRRAGAGVLMKFLVLIAALGAAQLGAQVSPSSPASTVQAVVAAPSGWTIIRGPSRLGFVAPEGDLTIHVVDVDGVSDAQAAAAAAWRQVNPAFARQVRQVSQDAASEGWKQIWRIGYVSSPTEQIGVRAKALRRDSGWTVVLFRGSAATFAKRSGAIIAFEDSLRPTGFVAEDFAGKRNATFDAARREQLKAFWRDAMVAYRVPGIGYAFFDRNGIVEEGGLGVRRVGNDAPVTAHTRFRIASNTKGMTTLLMARLVDQGRLAWDEPVTTAYPVFRLGDPATQAAIRVRHLVCACTGMPRQDLEWMIAGTRTTPASHVFDLLAPMKPTSRLGELYQYSNLLAAAGGYVAAHAAFPKMEVGAAYDRAMREQVFAPLGMTETTFDTAVALRADHAAPHDVALDGTVGTGPPNAGDSIEFARPAGGAWSSAHDMALYALNELREGVSPSGRRLVSRDALLERRRGGVEYGEATRYGMGIETITRWGVPVLHHGGALPGWGSDWYVLPEAGVGVVLLMNSESGRDIEQATHRRLIELLYGARPQAEAGVRAGGVALEADVREGARDVRVPADPRAVARLAARYANPALGQLTVTRDASGVTFRLPSVSSRVGTRVNSDGSTSYVMIDPATFNWRLLARPMGNRDALVIRDAQREYVFSPADCPVFDPSGSNRRPYRAHREDPQTAIPAPEPLPNYSRSFSLTYQAD